MLPLAPGPTSSLLSVRIKQGQDDVELCSYWVMRDSPHGGWWVWVCDSKSACVPETQSKVSKGWIGMMMILITTLEVFSPGKCGLQRATLQGYEICAKRIFLPVCFCKYIWVLSVDDYDETVYLLSFHNLWKSPSSSWDYKSRNICKSLFHFISSKLLMTYGAFLQYSQLFSMGSNYSL